MSLNDLELIKKIKDRKNMIGSGDRSEIIFPKEELQTTSYLTLHKLENFLREKLLMK